MNLPTVFTTAGSIQPCTKLEGLCNIDKSLTPASTLFIFVVLILFLALYLKLSKIYKDAWKRILFMMLGVSLFQFYTTPMWRISHLGMFGYMYLGTSWIITAAWTTILLSITTLIDKTYPKKHELQRFFASLPGIVIVGLIFENILSLLGIRAFAPEITKTSVLMLGTIPAEILYYLPVFSLVTISFYKYAHLVDSNMPLVPSPRRISFKNLAIASIVIFCMELLISPLVVTHNLPSWGYIYRDINIFRIGLWIVLIYLSTSLVDVVKKNIPEVIKMLAYVLVGSLIFFQIEGYLIQNGYRWFTESVTNNFSGFTTPISHLPIEVSLAIILYLTLGLSTIRFWRIVWDNKL